MNGNDIDVEWMMSVHRSMLVLFIEYCRISVMQREDLMTAREYFKDMVLINCESVMEQILDKVCKIKGIKNEHGT